MSTFSQEMARKELGQFLKGDGQLTNDELAKFLNTLEVFMQEDLDTYNIDSKDLNFSERKYRLLE